jgi:hypothetical protein
VVTLRQFYEYLIRARLRSDPINPVIVEVLGRPATRRNMASSQDADAYPRWRRPRSGNGSFCTLSPTKHLATGP